MTFEWNAPCYIRRAGWFIYAHSIHYEYKTVERRYIQEEPRIKAIAKEKSHFSRKSTHFQFKHDFATTSALARCTLIWARDSPLFDFFSHWSAAQQRKKVHRNRPSAFFPPHTFYTHKCYAFTRKNCRRVKKFATANMAKMVMVCRVVCLWSLHTKPFRPWKVNLSVSLSILTIWNVLDWETYLLIFGLLKHR